jgi:hypothetical protein
MTTRPEDAPRQLPDRPSLRHLKLQARDLLKSGAVGSIADAQFKIARLYGFASWPKLKAHIDSLEECGQLKDAIDGSDHDRVRTLMTSPTLQPTIERLHGPDGWSKLKAHVAAFLGIGTGEIDELKQAIGSDDIDRVKMLMTRNPALHGAPIGYGRSGPLTCVAEFSAPEGRPSAARLAMATWMIENGSDVHQGGDGPLMRAALSGQRIPMMELLVSHGADVNAEWHGEYPIIFAACEAVDPVALKWLLDHGANPNCDRPQRAHQGTALDYVIGSYVRSPDLGACIDVLLDAGGRTKYDAPVVLELLRGRLDGVNEHLRADPALVSTRFSGLDFGTTGGRLLTLTGATLLHVAAEYGSVEGIRLLLNRGANVNGRATLDEAGVGGQTAIFHAVTQLDDGGVPTAQLLIERGADLSIRVKLPGHYERPREVVECTPLGYALKFHDVPTRSDKAKTVTLLRERGAVE